MPKPAITLSDHIVKETMRLISDDLEISSQYLPAEGADTWHQLRKLVAEKVLYLMESDVEQLKYVLYRLDVGERKVKTVLAETPFAEAAERIAELILEREAEKARTRLQYGSGGSGDWLDV